MKILIEVIIIGSLAICKHKNNVTDPQTRPFLVIIVALCISGLVFLRTSLKIFGNEQIISNDSNRTGILAAIKAHDLVPQEFQKCFRADVGDSDVGDFMMVTV